MRYLIGQNAIVGPFVAAHIPHCRRGFGDQIMTLGVVDGERLIGGLVFHNHDPEAAIIEISGAAIDPRWLTRETLRLMHYYPFVDCKCQLAVMRVPADNERLLRQLAMLGYEFTLLRRLFGRERDGVLAALTQETWHAGKFFHHGVPPPIFSRQEAA
jgi:RimJ/RimL family protein N-acetyltransferase